MHTVASQRTTDDCSFRADVHVVHLGGFAVEMWKGGGKGRPSVRKYEEPGKKTHNAEKKK